MPVSNIGQPAATSLMTMRRTLQNEAYEQQQNLPSVAVEMTAKSEYNAVDTASAVTASKLEFKAMFITAATIDGYQGNLSHTSVS